MRELGGWYGGEGELRVISISMEAETVMVNDLTEGDKKMGPRVEPWGMPWLTGRNRMRLIVINCFPLVKYD